MYLAADSVLVVGCVHADPDWMIRQVLPAAREAEVDAVLVAGDFGYWPHSQSLLKIAATSKEKFGVDTWFIDGNHENFPMLARAVAKSRVLGDDPSSPVQLSGSLYYIPRGGRVTIGGLSAVCLGGAASIDRLFRTPDLDWFSEETITDADLAAVSAGGSADIMISHDCPSGWTIPDLTPIKFMAPEWVTSLPECWAHQKIVREGFELISPRLLVHSHYHSGYKTAVTEEWGAVQVVGLNCAHADRWALVVSAKDGEPTVSGWVSPIRKKEKTNPAPVPRWNLHDETLSAPES
jgi:hypothetical protein